MKFPFWVRLGPFSGANLELLGFRKILSGDFFSFIYGWFLKWWYPQNTQKLSFLVGKTMVVGETHHFRKPPYAHFLLHVNRKKMVGKPSSTIRPFRRSTDDGHQPSLALPNFRKFPSRGFSKPGWGFNPSIMLVKSKGIPAKIPFSWRNQKVIWQCSLQFSLLQVWISNFKNPHMLKLAF